MTTKIIIMTEDAQGINDAECRVLYTRNGAELEKRIESIIDKLKADGYKKVSMIDCLCLDYPEYNNLYNDNRIKKYKRRKEISNLIEKKSAYIETPCKICKKYFPSNYSIIDDIEDNICPECALKYNIG